MIVLKDKKDCCGCHACVSTCTHRAITMQADSEGFLYPLTNRDACTDCGLCEQVCPVIHQAAPIRPIKVFAARNNDEEIRRQSSSGGIFTLLGEAIIREGGVVFGAKFDEAWNVIHASAKNLDEMAHFRGSKYVQSTIGDTYKEAKKYLKQGRKVLFSGTPCQIAGLKRFLRKEYDNLLTIDIICHGVPSPLVWQKYLSETYAQRTITDISFRDKTRGWTHYAFRISTEEKTLLLPPSKNAYMRGFLKDLYLRPSCHACPAKNATSGSDITIADFWEIEKHDALFADDKGTSAVILNTPAGASMFAQINEMTTSEHSIQQIMDTVTTYHRSVPEHPKRNEFFERKDKASLNELVNEYVPMRKTAKTSLFKRIKKWILPNDFRIIWDKPGQTCNRLWSYLDTIGWSIRTQNKTYVLFWDKDIKYFDRLRKNPYIKFPLYNKTLVKWLGDAKYQKLLTWIFANRFLNRFYAHTNSKKFVYSWQRRASKEYFPYVMDEIRDLYTPNRTIIEEVKPVMEHYRNEGYFIIGVHIRRGDYKTFENGDYYFELDEYKQHMKDLCELYKDKKICFAISTNEKIDDELFKEFDICRTSNTTAIHDLYMLSLCDRIIGPLSTFSRWASFYGEVPLCFINRTDRIKSDEDFSVIKDFYHFANGAEIVNLTDRQTRI